MKQSEKIEFLQGYTRALKRETLLRERMEEYISRQRAASAIQYDGMPHGSALHDLSDYISRVEDDVERIHAQMNRSDEIRNLIDGCIQELEDETEQEILFLRYIRRMPMETVAENLFMGRSSAYRTHDLAVEHLDVSDRTYRLYEELMAG